MPVMYSNTDNSVTCRLPNTFVSTSRKSTAASVRRTISNHKCINSFPPLSRCRLHSIHLKVGNYEPFERVKRKQKKAAALSALPPFSLPFDIFRFLFFRHHGRGRRNGCAGGDDRIDRTAIKRHLGRIVDAKHDDIICQIP